MYDDRLAIAERERAAFLEERNQTRHELDSVRQRMNRLAVENARLEANQLPAGAVCFVPTAKNDVPVDGDYVRYDNGCFLPYQHAIRNAQPIYRRYESPPQGEPSIPIDKELEEARKEIERLKESCKSVSDLSIQFAKIDKANLDAKNAEIASLRKDREAWEAVRKHGIRLTQYFTHLRTTWVATNGSRYSNHHADPRDAVLALAKELEGKQTT